MCFYLQARRLSFTEAMKLEIERLHFNLSAAERDRALLSVGIDPAKINPNLLVDEHYMGRLAKVANALAVLGQASAEDKRIASIGLEIVEDDSIDFWNVSKIGEVCSGGVCEVRAETDTTGPTSSIESPGLVFCSHCER